MTDKIMMEKQFYKNLKLFLKDLIVVFPEDDESLQVISTTINLAIMDDDDHMIIKKFYTSLQPLESQIYNKDILVFSSNITKYWPENSTLNFLRISLFLATKNKQRVWLKI